MTAASACGISATDFATTIAANITSTPTSTRPATAPSMTGSFRSGEASLDDFLNYRGGAVDVHDGHVVAGFVDIVVVEGPRRPDFAVELHLPLVTRDPIEHQCALAFKLLRPVRQPGTRHEMPSQGRSDQCQQQHRDHREHRPVYPQFV